MVALQPTQPLAGWINLLYVLPHSLLLNSLSIGSFCNLILYKFTILSLVGLDWCTCGTCNLRLLVSDRSKGSSDLV